MSDGGEEEELTSEFCVIGFIFPPTYPPISLDPSLPFFLPFRSATAESEKTLRRTMDAWTSPYSTGKGERMVRREEGKEGVGRGGRERRDERLVFTLSFLPRTGI